MARPVLSPQNIIWSGLEATYSAADVNGHQFLNAGTGKDLILHVKNGDASDHTLTVQTALVVEGRYAVADNAIVITASEDRFVADFTKTTYNQDGVDTVAGEKNYVFIDFDAVTSVTLALLATPA